MSATFALFRDRLRAARERGESFEEAWARHFPRGARPEGREALEQTRAAWERAYRGEPATREERALVLVGHLFSEGDVERDAPRVVGVKVG